ncbi:MAG: GspH/FimT family pseudopilin [Myxococcota bacterium]|nr:GspH/FimT family pseudopilin [Myxococcota bacterium]
MNSRDEYKPSLNLGVQVRSARRWQGGFTIGELLGVVTIVIVVTMLAYPSMRTFSGGAAASGAATRLTHMFNQARSQAMRRNRAVIVDFLLFRAGTPGGRIDFLEARTNACTTASQQILEEGNAAALYLNSVLVGGTVVPGYKGTNEKNVGFSGWRRGSDGGFTANRLRLCLSPAGQTFVVAPNLQVLDQFVEVRVQRYKARGDAFEGVGAARRIIFPGFGAARMMVSQ